MRTQLVVLGGSIARDAQCSPLFVLAVGGESQMERVGCLQVEGRLRDLLVADDQRRGSQLEVAMSSIDHSLQLHRSLERQRQVEQGAQKRRIGDGGGDRDAVVATGRHRTDEGREIVADQILQLSQKRRIIIASTDFYIGKIGMRPQGSVRHPIDHLRMEVGQDNLLTRLAERKILEFQQAVKVVEGRGVALDAGSQGEYPRPEGIRELQATQRGVIYRQRSIYRHASLLPFLQ